MNGHERSKERLINDPIYGRVKLSPLSYKIIDTPHFQRLRNLKCLDVAYFVYPTATHCRFSHSIGVAHLARKCAKRLKKKQPELEINERDILAVEIAGLCHDIGHGPFSHLFQRFVCPHITSFKWQHEENSIRVFNDMLHQVPKLQAEMSTVFQPCDFDFIREAINPPQRADKRQWICKGRPEEKAFLYEIVANKGTGLDVDRFDYIRRDAFFVGINVNFDIRRLLDNMFVSEFRGRKRIVYVNKIKLDLMTLYSTRAELQAKVYQHKTLLLVGKMVTDALILAEPFLKFFHSSGKRMRLSEGISDVSTFLKMTDNLFETILHSESEDLKPAANLLQRVITRRFYAPICSIKLEPKDVLDLFPDVSIDKVTESWLSDKVFLKDVYENDLDKSSLAADVSVTVAAILPGEEASGKHNITVPLFNDKTKKLNFETIPLTPLINSSCIIRVYSKTNNPNYQDAIGRCCVEWCRRENVYYELLK